MPGEPAGMDTTRSYNELLSGIVTLLELGRQFAARSVNTVPTTTYWLVGQRLVEHEQGGEERAVYGAKLLKRLSQDLQSRMGRGFSERNLEQMRQLYPGWPIPQAVSSNSGLSTDPNISQTLSAKFNPAVQLVRFLFVKTVSSFISLGWPSRVPRSSSMGERRRLQSF